MNLADLVQKAARHGVDSIESAQGPLIPFTLVLDANPDRAQRKLTLTRHAYEDLGESLQAAQDSITPDPGRSMYTVAWDGYITVEGRKWDAVLIEAGESDNTEALIYAQRYELKEKGFFNKRRCNVAVGEPIATQPAPSRLWSGKNP